MAHNMLEEITTQVPVTETKLEEERGARHAQRGVQGEHRH